MPSRSAPGPRSPGPATTTGGPRRAQYPHNFARRRGRHHRSPPAAQRLAGVPRRQSRAGRVRLTSPPTGCAGPREPWVHVGCRTSKSSSLPASMYTQPGDVIPGGQGTGYQQTGHPAKAVQAFGKMTDGRRHVGHPPAYGLHAETHRRQRVQQLIMTGALNAYGQRDQVPLPVRLPVFAPEVRTRAPAAAGWWSRRSPAAPPARAAGPP